MLTRLMAIENLKKYIGQDLLQYAKEFWITVYKDWKQNKWWKWQVLEKLAGLENNNKKAPNGLWFELKSVSFKKVNGKYKAKETMAITMINQKELLETPFLKSHCREKLKSIIICAVHWERTHQSSSVLLDVTSLDFQDDDDLIKEIQEDYEYIREKLKTQWFLSLTGRDWKRIQARTKWPWGVNKNTWNRNPITRAFYARVQFLDFIFTIND